MRWSHTLQLALHFTATPTQYDIHVHHNSNIHNTQHAVLAEMPLTMHSLQWAEPQSLAWTLPLASFPVVPRTRFTFTCDNCGGEHFETGKAWSETSREVDVVLYIIVQVPLPPGVYLPVLL